MRTHRKLNRSSSNKKLAGVCGGLGEYFGISPFFFRLFFFIAFLPGGAPGLLLYLIFFLCMGKPSQA